MNELVHDVEHDELEGNNLSSLTPALIAHIQKVGGQEYGRLAFEQLFGPPDIGVVDLLLMQKTASISNKELFSAAERVCPENPIQLYEELGGGYKLAGVVDRAKGFARVGELLSGSRAGKLDAAKSKAVQEAERHLPEALKYDHKKVTPKILGAIHKGKVDKLPSKDRDVVQHANAAHANITNGRRAERLGKVLKAEQGKVRGARAGAAGVGAAAVAGGVVAARHKNSDR